MSELKPPHQVGQVKSYLKRVQMKRVRLWQQGPWLTEGHLGGYNDMFWSRKISLRPTWRARTCTPHICSRSHVEGNSRRPSAHKHRGWWGQLGDSSCIRPLFILRSAALDSAALHHSCLTHVLQEPIIAESRLRTEREKGTWLVVQRTKGRCGH